MTDAGHICRLKPPGPRNTHEAHRAATPLELLFDLASVIAIAAAANGLHHAIVEAHIADGLIKFSCAFFMIWWAWMNFTWHASAYDNDDALFRVLTLTIMAGATLLAAGIKPFFSATDLSLALAGFIIMRVAMVALWLRAARHDPDRHAIALCYAMGITLVQCYWIIMILNQPQHPGWFYALFALGIALELSVPAIAEAQGQSPWHRHHMIERYGLLNIIVLGEGLLATTWAIGSITVDTGQFALFRLALSAFIVIGAMWWLYFSREDHLQQDTRAMAFSWGYGHIAIYLSGAATGAGFAALSDILAGQAQVNLQTGLYAVAIPLALYWLGLWFVRDRHVLKGTQHYALLVFAVLILLAPLALPIEAIALLTIMSVATRSHIARKLADSKS